MNKRPTSKFFRIMTTSLQFLALGLVCEGLMLGTAFATAIKYSSNADLDLNGNFHSAVNFGGPQVVINGTTFSQFLIPNTVIPGKVGAIGNVTVESLGLPATPGAPATSRVRNPGGINVPTFGGGLGTISSTVALSDGGASAPDLGVPTTMGIKVVGLSTGQQYKLQLLFFDVFQTVGVLSNGTEKRFFDIVIEGALVEDDFDIIALTGSDREFGALVRHSFTALDSVLDIELRPAGNYFPAPMPDPNFSPMISALTVEIVPEPSTMLLLGSGLAGLVAWRYRKSTSKV